MRIKLGELRQFIRESLGSAGKTVKLNQKELHALKASMVQGMDIDQVPEWRAFYDDVYEKLNSESTAYPVTVVVPVSPEWDDEITGAIEGEVMGRGQSYGNSYGIRRGRLIQKVTSDVSDDEDEENQGPWRPPNLEREHPFIRLIHLGPESVGLTGVDLERARELIDQRNVLNAEPPSDHSSYRQHLDQINDELQDLIIAANPGTERYRRS